MLNRSQNYSCRIIIYDYDISTSAGKNYKVMLNVDGSGDIKLNSLKCRSVVVVHQQVALEVQVEV